MNLTFLLTGQGIFYFQLWYTLLIRNGVMKEFVSSWSAICLYYGFSALAENITITQMNLINQNPVRRATPTFEFMNIPNVTLSRILFANNYGFQNIPRTAMFALFYMDVYFEEWLTNNGFASDQLGVFIMDNCTLYNNTLEDSLSTPQANALGIVAFLNANYTISNTVIQVNSTPYSLFSYSFRTAIFWD